LWRDGDKLKEAKLVERLVVDFQASPNGCCRAQAVAPA